MTWPANAFVNKSGRNVVEVATGLASCTICGNRIPQGEFCVHHRVNTRAEPFICRQCILGLADSLAGDAKGGKV
jgi:hypothetical protein